MSEEIQLAAGAAAGIAEVTEATGGLGTLGINLKIFLAQLFNFTLVLLVLWKWAYKPIVKLLDERAEKIEKSVLQADEIDKRVKDLEVEQKVIVKEARAEASKIIEEARGDGDVRKQKILDQAKEEVQGVIASGKVQLQAEKEAMIQQAREDIAKIAVAAAQKILSEAVDEKQAQKLAEDVVSDMTR